MQVQKASQLIEEGEIGKVYYACANYFEGPGLAWYVCILLTLQNYILLCHYCRPEGVFEGLTYANNEHHWTFESAKAGGGTLMQGATHWIRPLRIWSVTTR